ncbi:hypothetical protein SAMN04488515_1794 [Cognatiyoonia koreensis]|uniref:Acetolactate synthase n=1 Tax=Cognatiyoonia koreensis TaxID=364200 RepID=A0A1I0QBM9_9RHOB|nr:DUF6497 family protein [Cognatiyoonia koreensis]SEW24252.1 hypothetical protein SAMN04488515_1794 [Cognatiyoonia koreensis]
MMRLAAGIALIAAPAVAQELTAPSGLKLNLYDVIIEDDAALARFRFEVPEIADNGLPFADVADDLQALCNQTLLPGLQQSGWDEGQIVVQLSAEKVDFGATVPDITQYFQPFSIDGDACIWEDF